MSSGAPPTGNDRRHAIVTPRGGFSVGTLSGPSDNGHGSRAVDALSPAHGAIIESTTAEDGIRPIVTYALTFAGRGALGLETTGGGDAK